MTSYFLTGATGYIGGTVAARLLGAGHRVRGLVRTPENAERLIERGIDPVVGTLDDFELLTLEARASDGVIDTASADHAESVAALIEGLKGSSKPFLHTSGSSVIGDDARGNSRSEAVFDEDTPFVVDSSKLPRRAIDLAVLESAASGVRSVVLCPSNIYGTGEGMNPDSAQIPLLARNARAQGVVQVVGAGLNVWSNVHISDVADLYVLALSGAPAGAFYFAENGEASFGEIGAAIAKRLGLDRCESLAPAEAAKRWGERTAYFSLGSNSRVRARRARRELDWKPKHASVLSWIENEMP